MYKSIWMAVVGEVLPCVREVNNYIVQTHFRVCNFRTDAQVQNYLEDENFLKYGFTCTSFTCTCSVIIIIKKLTKSSWFPALHCPSSLHVHHHPLAINLPPVSMLVRTWYAQERTYVHTYSKHAHTHARMDGWNRCMRA